MEEELLRELDSILNPAVQNAWSCAKRTADYGGDPRNPFLDRLKIELDHTKVELSKTMYKLDMAMQGCGTDVERAVAEVADLSPPDVQELPDVDERDYVRPIQDGFEVWDGIRWVPLAKEANIKLEVFQNPENGNRPAVRVWAHDENTQTSVVFIDNDLYAPGWDVANIHEGDSFDGYEVMPIQRSHYWEDPFYNMAKNGNAIGGLTAGVLEMRHVGNMTPWLKGDAFRNADGWFRTVKGEYEYLSKQRGFASGAGGFQGSARKALEKAEIFKGAGKVFFAISVGFSAVESGHAFYTQDNNRNEVYTKAVVDVAIGYIGLAGGPVGWIIAGTYFILDSSGAFGDWGRPSGISQNHYNWYLRNKVQQEYGAHLQSLKFDLDYVAPIEHQQKEMYLEERMSKRDNTNVALPKILFRKD